MSEMIVKFHQDERGIARSWDEVGELIRCKDCKFTDGKKPIADGRYWCVRHSCFMYYCSDAERRTDESN